MSCQSHECKCRSQDKGHLVLRVLMKKWFEVNLKAWKEKRQSNSQRLQQHFWKISSNASAFYVSSGTYSIFLPLCKGWWSHSLCAFFSFELTLFVLRIWRQLEYTRVHSWPLQKVCEMKKTQSKKDHILNKVL